MCGIAGCFGPKVSERYAIAMGETLKKRGPDDFGSWVDQDSGIAFSHTRLAILDLSQEGRQPMVSYSGRYTMVYNGEIYNHLELRTQLEEEGYKAYWKGHSDTETLLSCFEFWGIIKTIKKAMGMFAIALWDAKYKKLNLIRDRLGEKPLYFGWCKDTFVFGSELKAIKKFPDFHNEIDPNVLALYLKFMYVPAPYSIYKNIFKLEPGCILSTDIGSSISNLVAIPKAPISDNKLSISRYWSIENVARSGISNLFQSKTEALVELEEKIYKSIARQSLSDVPIGAFLSGGIDSSTIVAIMQTQSEKAINTFSIGFNETSLNEAKYAKEVARHLGTNHTELYVTSKEAQEVIPSIPEIYCEPFADSSQIPTYLVSRLARNTVTVALSGDGGDELFCGYNRYFWGNKIWNKVAWIPFHLRSLIGTMAHHVPSKVWELSQKRLSISRLEEKVQKMAIRLKTVKNLDQLYESLVSEWTLDHNVVVGANEPYLTQLNNEKVACDFQEPENRMMIWDILTYLSDDILHKVDRAAMAVSLETRVPFLDPDVVETAWRIPLDMKLSHGQSKWILRQVLYKYVPEKLIDRPKAGFAMPTGEWLRGPLKEWVESLINEDRLIREGHFYAEPIRKKWSQHLAGTHDWTNALWSVLMFQTWKEKMDAD